MNEVEVLFLDDGERLLNVVMIESITDVDSLGDPSRNRYSTGPHRRVMMQSGRAYSSKGGALELVKVAQETFAAARGIDLSDVRFPPPGRPVTD